MQAHKVVLWICLVLVAAFRSAEARPQILESIGEGIGAIFEGIGDGIGEVFEGVGDFVGSLTQGRGTTPSVPPGAGVPLPPPTFQAPGGGGLNNFGSGPAGLPPTTFQQGGGNNIGAGTPPPNFQGNNIGAGTPTLNSQQSFNSVGGAQFA